MGQRSYPEEASEVLLEQFELILDYHKHIDEVGFVHPSQFVELNEDSSVSWSPPFNIWQILDDSCAEDTTSLTCLQKEKTVFWYGNHKLAISMQVVPLLYNAAQRAHMDARRNYKRKINTPKTKISLNTATHEVLSSETDILRHSRALLILSPDFGSVWNSRKLMLSREPELPLLIDELNLSTLVLSYSPKSEQAWSHRQPGRPIDAWRGWLLLHSNQLLLHTLGYLILLVNKFIRMRWVIKKVAEKFHDLYDIIGNESEFVKRIAEKSKMNYRAWNHRCWLIPYMNKWQMFDELDKSRKWAELHVSDSCCYHYRRRLLLNLLEENSLKDDGEKSSFYKCLSVDLLKEELNWNVHLIKQYMGREALWIHRRYLSYYWINRITNPIDLSFPIKTEQEMTPALDCFLREEIELIHSCLSFPADEFDDARAQAQHAATYILWIYKTIILSPEYRFQEKLKQVGDLKTILIKTSPEKTLIWERLLDQFPAESEKHMPGEA